METLIIKAIFKGYHPGFEKNTEYYLILTKIENGWQLMTIDDERKQIFYHNLKEFINEWSNIDNL